MYNYKIFKNISYKVLQNILQSIYKIWYRV